MGKGKFYKKNFESKNKLKKKLIQFCLPHGHLVRLFKTNTEEYVDIRSSSYGYPTKYGIKLLLPEYLEMVQKLKNEVNKLMEESNEEEDNANGLIIEANDNKENICLNK